MENNNKGFLVFGPEQARGLIKQTIKKVGIKRAVLAERLGVDTRVLRRWLNGDCKMDFELMNFILSGLGMSIQGIILSDDDDARPMKFKKPIAFLLSAFLRTIPVL